MKRLQQIFLILLLGGTWAKAEEVQDPMSPAFLVTIVNKLERGENVVFTKYGDGEYLCMIGERGANRDGDCYHNWLGKSLKKALVNLVKKPNVYIGKWWTSDASGYCNNIAQNIPWANYHLFMNDDRFMNFDYMHTFVNFIVTTKRKKIVMSNGLNRRLKDFFRADEYLEIPQKNWSFEYNRWKTRLEGMLEKDAIVLLCGGLCSKVLIDDITSKYQVTMFDLGSSFDVLASGRNFRCWKHSYEDEVKYYKDFIPDSWK